jgi:hypothetical protein
MVIRCQALPDAKRDIMPGRAPWMSLKCRAPGAPNEEISS